MEALPLVYTSLSLIWCLLTFIILHNLEHTTAYVSHPFDTIPLSYVIDLVAVKIVPRRLQDVRRQRREQKMTIIASGANGSRFQEPIRTKFFTHRHGRIDAID